MKSVLKFFVVCLLIRPKTLR